MVTIYFQVFFDEAYNNAYYTYSPWLIENVYSPGGRHPWKWIYEDEIPIGIIFYNDSDATAFRLVHGL